MFVPQVVMAIAGSLALPTLARRFSLKRVLLAGMVADTVAMGLLAGSDPLQGDAIAYPMLLVATAALGLGFGLTLGSISTYAGAFMPDRRDVALTALNVLLGLGTALSPFLIALFTDVGQWWYLPLLAAAGLLVLIGLTAGQPMDVPAPGSGRTARVEGARPGIPPLFWLFAAALVIYGIGETMFGNWGTTLLVGKGVSATSANDALAVFWAAVTIGRLVIAVVSTRVRSTHIYVALPWAIAAALLLFPIAGSAGGRHRGVRLRRPGLFRLLPDDRRLRGGHLPEHRRAGGRMAHRRLPGRLRPRRLRRRGPAALRVAVDGVPHRGGGDCGDGRAGARRRPPPAPLLRVLHALNVTCLT